MNKKTGKLLIAFAISILIVTLSLLMVSQINAVVSRPTSLSTNQDDSFTPTVLKPAWVDQNNNGIADSLDQEIADRIANGTAQDYVNVTIMLKDTPTTQDADAFFASGGYLTTDAWTEATYGFGGTITYDGIANFVQQCPDVLLIEKEAIGEASIAYAAQQVGARTYVWNTVGLQGDPNSSIAIVDTGIDGSHVDFAPGYGSQNFSKKIVGWSDQVGSTTSPVDDNGHGSHCSGLSAGDGFFNVDGSGNAITTYGANFGYLSAGTYIISGIMVNKTGPIALNVKWARSGSSSSSLSSLSLWYGDKTLNTTSWSQVASVNTPSQNTFYPLTYNVASTPAGGYDMYHIRITATTGTSGSLYVTFNMTWPYMPPSDGFSAWTGIAPQSKLVGVKVLNSAGSGTTTQMVNGINWLINNRQTYHVTVASMSLGFSSEVSSVDSAVLNLVNSGVTCVVAAGNSGSGSNYIYTPGSVDEVMTVAAMSQFDNIASYSSQGGTSRYTGKTMKPDITAPGGSFYAVPLFSADSNYNDAEGGFTEMLINDSTPMQGTSMATPVMAGCAQIVIQAMGGYASWNYTSPTSRSLALKPKMILLMTAAETYPNIREGGTTSTSPTLERGGKDVHEGYGRVNLDAAVDAILKSYGIGNAVTDALGSPPTLADISVVGQRLVWARNVQLVSGYKYNFSLSVPTGADYDLYLYNSTGTTYGEPAIVAKSINATTGGTEQFWVTAPYTGTYYVAVKRATETTGSGNFTLSSSGPVNVTLNTPGLPSASNVVHYTQNSAPKTGSIIAYRFSDYADTGTTMTIDNPINVSSTQRYITTDPTSFTIQSNATFTVNYKTQYYITVNSGHDVPTASQWADQGGNLTVGVTSPADNDGAGTRYRSTGYTLDGNPPVTDGSTSYAFGNIQSSHSITFNWVTQYKLTIASDHDSPAPGVGDHWYDTGTHIDASVTSPAEESGGTRYRCTGYTGTGSVSSGSGTSVGFDVNEPSTLTWNWMTQYQISFDQTGIGSDFTDAVVTIDGTNYSLSDLPVIFWWDDGSSHAFAFQSPLTVTTTEERYVWNSTTGLSTAQSDLLTITSSGSVTGNYGTQYYLTVLSLYDTGGGTGWYDSGTTAYATLINGTVDIVPSWVKAVFTDWSGDASGASLTSNPISMNGPKTAIADWEIQYYLQVATGPSSLPPIPGADWYDNWTWVNLVAPQYVPNATGASGVRYNFTNWDVDGAPQGTGVNSVNIHMDTSHLATAHFALQYLVTFNQTGVNSDFAGTVVVIDGSNYDVSDLPASFWYDSGSTHGFAFQSPLVVGSGAKQYDWTSTEGLSTLQSESIIITNPGSVTGNYVTHVHDVTVTNITADRTWVYQGFSANINVTVKNNGDFTEDVTVTLYYDITAGKIVGIQNATLFVGESKTLLFLWDTTGVPYCHNYTLTAVATIPADYNAADNSLDNTYMKVRILGDVDGDGKVDGKDIALAAFSFGTVPGNARWNPDADINLDVKIDGKDLVLIALRFGMAACSP